MDDLSALENWAAPLLGKLQPAQVRTLVREVARDLRKSQSARIATQQAPDGTPYTPRKPANSGKKYGTLRAQKGKIRDALMFKKLRLAQHLRADATATEAVVGFVGRTSRIARVHQEGLSDSVKPGGPSYHYPARQLLGLTRAERERITDQLLKHLTS